MDGGAWWATVHGVAKSQTRLSNLTHSLGRIYEGMGEVLTSEIQKEKAMASHSSTFAWKIPWTEEPGGLQSDRKSVV